MVGRKACSETWQTSSQCGLGNQSSVLPEERRIDDKKETSHISSIEDSVQEGRFVRKNLNIAKP
jgi:hypothetical protein